MKQLALLCTLLWASTTATAASTQREMLIYEGGQSPITMAGKATLPVPPSTQLAALRQQQPCAATGGPLPHWAIIGSTLYLTHFSLCGNNVQLGAVYEGVTSPLVATWVTGTLRASRGPVICFTVEQGAVADMTLTFTVAQGIVTDVEESDNSGTCPDAADP